MQCEAGAAGRHNDPPRGTPRLSRGLKIYESIRARGILERIKSRRERVFNRLDPRIGCKACEVACKEWNGVAEDGLDSGFSYDNTGAVGHSTWCVRHVRGAFAGAGFGGNAPELSSWGFSLTSTPAKMPDAWKLVTGSIVRTEFGGVYVQPDI